MREALHHGWCKHKLSVEIYKDQAAIADQAAIKSIDGAGSFPVDESTPKADPLSPEEKAKLESDISELYS